MRKGFAALFVAFAMLVSPAMAAAVGKAAPAGSIHFDVHYGAQGFKIGEARHDWRLAGNKYEMSLNLEAKGLAGLFGLQYEQRSVGTVDAKGMRPERFSVDQRGRMKVSFSGKPGAQRAVSSAVEQEAHDDRRVDDGHLSGGRR